MITDVLKSAGLYSSLHPRFAAGFDFLRKASAALKEGRHDLDGDNLFALIQGYTTTPAAERKFEHHRKYADIQFMLSGAEVIEYAPLDGLAVETPYAEAKDFGLLRNPPAASSIVLNPGAWAIFFPHDAHKPGCSLGASAAVRKIVVKVLL